MQNFGREILGWNRGGGCLLVFGFPFFAAGLLLLGMALRFVPLEGGQPPLIVLFVIGFFIAGIGIFLMFAREKIVLNRGQGFVARGWRLLVPLKWQQERLNDFRRVLLKGNSGRGSHSSDAFYSVALERVYSGQEFAIEESGNYLAARQTAERVARFLKFPLSDSTSGKEVLREPDQLDEPYRSRARRLGEKILLPEPPGSMTARIKEESGCLAIEIPPPGPGKKAMLRLIPPIIVTLVIFYFFSGFRQLPMPDAVRVFLSGFFGLFMLLPILSGLRDFITYALRAERLTLTDDILRIDHRQGFRWKTVEMQVNEIEEMYLPEHPRLEGVRLPGGKLMLPENFIQTKDRKVPSPGDLGRGVVIGKRTQAALSWIMKIAPGAKITFLTDRSMESFGRGLGSGEMAYIFAKVRQFMVESSQ
jgi:hypothetical protein